MGNRLMFRPGYRAPVVESIATTQGEVVAFSLDPLEQAIESTARSIGAEADRLDNKVNDSSLYHRLGTHLDALLAEQLKRVQANE
jgi:hypothetical protein